MSVIHHTLIRLKRGLCEIIRVVKSSFSITTHLQFSHESTCAYNMQLVMVTHLVPVKGYVEGRGTN